MTSELGLLIMMNNYLHDVATAMLACSGVVMWIIVRHFRFSTQDAGSTKYFLKIYQSVTKLARFSLSWILIGGIPRIIFYKDFEWANAVGKGQVPALIVKHILAFIFVGAGAYMWLKISKRIKEIKTGRKATE